MKFQPIFRQSKGPLPTPAQAPDPHDRARGPGVLTVILATQQYEPPASTPARILPFNESPHECSRRSQQPIVQLILTITHGQQQQQQLMHQHRPAKATGTPQPIPTEANRLPRYQCSGPAAAATLTLVKLINLFEIL